MPITVRADALDYDKRGQALYADGRLAEAAVQFERATELEPGEPGFAYHAAVSLHALDELDRAAAAYRRVLSVCPGHTESIMYLAIILKEQGCFEESIQKLREILKLQPDHALAYFSLSEFAAEGRYQFTAEELWRIRSLIASERSHALVRSFCCFALASVLNKQGAYDDAFAYCKQGNDLRLGLMQAQNQAFDARANEAFVGRIIATEDAGYFQRTRGWGVITDLPIFIVGIPRSGSTLIEQILASHPQAFGAGETGAFCRSFSITGPKGQRPSRRCPPANIRQPDWRSISCSGRSCSAKGPRGLSSRTSKTSCTWA
jgi:tetratricopeptide (TPR) repeat protein